MADDVEGLAQWIVGNQDKTGTPEYVTKAQQYREARSAQRGAALPDIGDVVRQKNAAEPYSVDNTMHRMFTSAVTGIPDLVIGGGNAIARAVGDPGAQQPYLGPKMLDAGGAAPLPQDAGYGRRILEAGGSALIGGGAGAAAETAATSAAAGGSRLLPAVQSLLTTSVAAPAAATGGGAAGGWVGEKLGDRETGELLGSLVGGVGGGAAGAGATRYTASRFAGQGKPNAAEIYTAADRQGVTPTAGMLGNADIQLREKNAANRTGSRDYINDRRQNAQQQMRDALDRLATERGSTNPAPTPGTIGQDVSEAARAAAEDLRTRSEQGQQRMQDRIGADAPVAVQGVYDEGYGAMRNQSVPGRQALDFRLTDQLSPLLNRETSGQPIITQGSPTVPYEPFRRYRTDLGRSIDTQGGGRMPPTAQLYGPATDAMRTTAERQGVPPQNFENVQGRTRQVEREGGDYQFLDSLANREPSSAYNYLRAGEQNPDRLGMLEATQRPEIDRVFGDYMRLLGNDTLNQEGARGPIRFANRVDSMHPDARSTISGPQQGGINDISTLARSFDYPTGQNGLGRVVGSIGGDAARTVIGSDVGAGIGAAASHLTGIPGGSTVGRIASLAVLPLINNIRARMLQSPTALNAMAGRPTPTGYGINDLVASLNAAEASQQPQRGPRNALPR